MWETQRGPRGFGVEIVNVSDAHSSLQVSLPRLEHAYRHQNCLRMLSSCFVQFSRAFISAVYERPVVWVLEEIDSSEESDLGLAKAAAPGQMLVAVSDGRQATTPKSAMLLT